MEQIYIFCNPVATKDAAKLGYYPGERDLKILDGQIGNFLTGKFGDRTEVDRLVQEGKLRLVPASDSRGLDIPAGSAIYITEA